MGETLIRNITKSCNIQQKKSGLVEKRKKPATRVRIYDVYGMCQAKAIC